MSPPSLSAVGQPDPLSVLNSIGEVLYDWDIATDRIVWGPNARDVLGLDALSRVESGAAYALCLSPESPSSRYEAVVQSTERDFGAGVRYETQYGLTGRMRGALADIWVEDTGRWFAGCDGRPARAHGLVRIVTERFEATKRLAFLSRFDQLTGAFNRIQLGENLTQRLADTGRGKTSFGLLLAGIERLGLYNRSYGYDIGDEIIAGVVQRLRELMRSTDLLARYAGNKLAIVLDACDEEHAALAAQRFLTEIAARPVPTRAGPLPVNLRIGGIIAPRHARTPQLICQRVEEALDAARESATARYVAYQPSLQVDVTRRHTQSTAEQIVAALNARRIEIALEPVVAAATTKTAFQEALLRLRLEDGELLRPAAFLPVAEQVGLIQLLDQRVMELALARMVADPDLHVSVNVSGASLHEVDWADRTRAALSVQKDLAARLVIEITETVAIADPAATQRIIATLKGMGVRVAMDDFGAGHTSFRNLRALGFDYIKIDGAFVQNLGHSSDDRFFVRTLVDLARHLGVATVAEWVEDEATASLLREWGVDYFQGELFRAGEPSLPALASDAA